MRNTGIQSLTSGIALAGLLLAGAASAATSTYDARLSWTIPTQRANGQALAPAELAGYEVYYTADDPNVSGVVKIDGGNTTSTTVSKLAAGNYYFTISAIDAAGLKSEMSAMVPGTVGAASAKSDSSAVSDDAALAPAGNYSVNLSWTAPDKRTNGKSLPLSQLAAYELAYTGGTPAVTRVVQISGGSSTKYTATGLTPGAYQFTISAIDTDGLKSAASTSVSTTIKGSVNSGGTTAAALAGNTGAGSASGSGSTGSTDAGSAPGATSPATGTGTVAANGSGTGTTGTNTTTTTTTVLPASYKAQLSWDIPSQRENGTPLQLSELSGYEVYYTSDDPALSGSIKVSGGATASATVANLTAGSYYFSISAVDNSGLKSELSTLVPMKFGP